MRLLIVNQYGLPAGRPGITRHGDLGAALVRMGHDVVVLASRFNYLTRSERQTSRVEQHEGVEFRWLNTGSYAGNDRSRIGSMLRFTARAVWEGSRIARPDVVLASSPHLLAGLAGILISRRHGVPFVFEVRDLWPSVLVDLGAVRRGSVVHQALVTLERRCYRSADRIVTVPPHADRRVAELGVDARKCVHIPNATSAVSGAGIPLPRSLMEVLDDAGERELLVYAGAQGVSNGLDSVLLGLAQLRSVDRPTFDRLAVLVVGDGGQHTELVDAAQRLGLGNIRFHPPIEKATIPGLLERADFLLVSFADAPVYGYGLSPNKLFDYLAAGRPVLLATRLHDTAVSEADAGRTFTPGSAKSFAAELRALLSATPPEREAMGERGRRLVEQRYTISTTAAQLDALLRDVSRRG